MAYMKDMLNQEIQADDEVAVCVSKGTNQTLCYGVVTEVTETFVKYKVLSPGKHFGYGNEFMVGDLKKCNCPHRMIVVRCH